jgi:ABC transport system ATP-binding/permease protein
MLLSIRKICKSYGAQPLFTGLELHLGEADRIGIIGANGSGKSTLLKILAGIEEPDQGERIGRSGLRIGYVPQDPVFDAGHTVAETVANSLEKAPPDPNEDEIARRVRVRMALGRLGFTELDQLVGRLSGGWQKRLAIAKALVSEPEILLLDEPTNHLDLAGILWLEQLLGSAGLPYVIVTHDRTLLERVAATVVELDPRHPGGLLAVAGGYRAFVEKRAEVLASRAQGEEALANRVRRELQWLHRGARARRTKARGHIREAQTMIADLERIQAKAPREAAEIEMCSTGRKSKRLMVLQGISLALGGRTLFSGLDLVLRPGMCLGLVGGNGSGKTSLLRVLAGEIPPNAGTLDRLDGLSVLHFTQNRPALPPQVSLRRALAPEGDTLVYRGQEVHVTAWARRFGFFPEQVDQAADRLSGGELARVAIARLMLCPADVLLLDEPTNDLDLLTLEELEESLIGFPGAVVLVSHDRCLLDRVCTGLLHLNGLGGVELLADVAQWEALLVKPRTAIAKKPKPEERPSRKRSLTYREKCELEGVEAAILAAEERSNQARSAFEDPAIASDAARLQSCHVELQRAETEVERLYNRWAELDAKQKG